MGKHAIGTYMTNFNDRMDTLAHVLHYPQKPLVTTHAAEIQGCDELPSGWCPIVLCGSFTGYDQDDGVTLNQSALDRGMGCSTFYRTYKDDAKKLGSNYCESFEKPSETNCIGVKKDKSTAKLSEEDGVAEVGARVCDGDYIIGKTGTYVPTGDHDAKYTKKDFSTMSRTHEKGIVDKVLMTTNQDGYRLTKVRVRSVRRPQIGDKFR
jgi:DNA-directed RNA polymerase II subunit RPB2